MSLALCSYCFFRWERGKEEGKREIYVPHLLLLIVRQRVWPSHPATVLGGGDRVLQTQTQYTERYFGDVIIISIRYARKKKHNN